MANQGKIWRYVKPSTGVPIFFIGIVVTALLVHFAVLTKTDWFGAYWNGGKKAAAAAAAPAAPAVIAPVAAK